MHASNIKHLVTKGSPIAGLRRFVSWRERSGKGRSAVQSEAALQSTHV